MAVVFKNRVRREIPDDLLSKWEADGWHLAGAAPSDSPKPSKPSLKVVMEETPESEDDPEDSTIEPSEEE